MRSLTFTRFALTCKINELSLDSTFDVHTIKYDHDHQRGYVLYDVCTLLKENVLNEISSKINLNEMKTLNNPF